MNILGIQRANEFSPNHINNDSAIFGAVIAELEGRGATVKRLTEQEFFHSHHVDERLIISMVRNKANLAKLQGLERNGVCVINSAFGVERCFRANMTRLLLDNRIPYPESRIISTTVDSEAALREIGLDHFWVKRGDFHAMHKEDVCFCANLGEGYDLLKEFALRGIPDAVISKHLIGDLVKFYAVRGTSFFYWFYPFDENHVKFDNQQLGEKTMFYNFDLEQLKKIADNAAQLLGIEVYGGDAIIDAEGNMQLIDVNDWPSFAPCRGEAAQHIAERILSKAKE